MQLLIADKSELIIQRLEELLSESAFNLTTDRAFSYEEAKLLYKEHEHEIVVLDINFPGNASYRLIKEIKTVSPQTVVIVLSFRLDEHIQQQCTKLKADYFLDKYNEFDHVPAIINRITEKKSA